MTQPMVEPEPSFLITGFEPFDGMSENLSGRLVEHLENRGFGGAAGIKCDFAVLPVSYREAGETIRRLLAELSPSVVLSFGIGRGDPLITIERVALNLDDAECADNAGEIRTGRPIRIDGPPAAFATVPVEAIQEALTRQGIPSVISNHAGAFLCNHVLYEFLTQRGRSPRAGFFHLPRISWSPELGESLQTAVGVICETISREASAI